MIQVKEIMGYGESQTDMINKWLLKHSQVKIIDIKYSVGTTVKTNENDGLGSGVLIIYEED